jgi:adenine/guanine phosphoribosyltransferase-like PRPP-binding protein
MQMVLSNGVLMVNLQGTILEGMPVMHCASHLYDALTPESLRERVDWAKLVLAKYDYDAIAVRGVSGLVYGTALAYALGKNLVVVRKPGECTGDYGYR